VSPSGPLGALHAVRGDTIAKSVQRVAGGAWEGDRVAHVRKAGEVGEGALETEAQAGGTVPWRRRSRSQTGLTECAALSVPRLLYNAASD
jgi:hypothetical protein